ncbi:putative NRPS-like protein biosynthetic cluster [Tricholoma furcatifolium]|nr:putative NRPS-like protein biosynthetic cluster [Tricholoma furcatifolium]
MPSPPPIYPSIEDHFIPEVLDFNFTNNAKQPFFTFAYPGSPNRVQFISHLEFGRAAHRVAHALRPKRCGIDGEVVAIIASSDTILYQALITGCIVAGLVPFPISPRNSPGAIVNLLQKTSCCRIITTNITLKSLIDAVRIKVENTPLAGLLIEEAPSLATAYPNLGHETIDDPFERYPNPDRRPFKDAVCIYLHSSGSTGLPKAVAQTHAAWQNWALLPSVGDFKSHRPRLTHGGMALPPFHAFGLYIQLLGPLYGIVAAAVYPPMATAPNLLPFISSPQSVLDHAKLTGSTTLIVIPSMLHAWSQSPEVVEFLATMQLVASIRTFFALQTVFSGGSLAQKVGDQLVNAGVRLRSAYGGTEFGSPGNITSLENEEKDWEYIRFGSDRVNVQWAPQGDGTFECQFLASEKHRPMVLNLPDDEGYATSDLFAKHPQKEDMWKIVGRVDDVIVHASGEKTVPAPMEDVIMSSPLVQGVVMFGRERDQTGILIEPTSENAIDVEKDGEVAFLRNKLWLVVDPLVSSFLPDRSIHRPIVEEANKVAPAFSRLFKETILFSSRGKPLPRSGKGSVMRKLAITEYEKEITELYNAVDSNIKAQKIVPPASWTLDDIQTWILDQAAHLLSKNELSSSVDLFEQGFDSLSATILRLRIVGALRGSDAEKVRLAALRLTQNLVYSYPTVQKLAAHIIALSTADRGSLTVIDSDRRAQIEGMIDTYSVGLDGPSQSTSLLRTSPAVVLLTGSTGNLGSEILAALLEDARVEHVYAFNRPSQETFLVEQRQLNVFNKRGLKAELLSSDKVSYLSGDATQANLGLDEEQYCLLSRSVNVIIHNAWKLDFNLSLSAFKPNIQGTRHLIDLLKSGPRPMDSRFLFTSSVASAQSWPKTNGPYPEEVLNDASFAVGNGYGESKYVAERILVKSGLRATAFRIGQLSGGKPKGAWATTDWVPILVKSSLTIGLLPDMEGVLSWLPMDAAAAAIVDAALKDTQLPHAINIVHPRPVEGKQVISFIQSAIEQDRGRHLTIVPFREWLVAIEAHAGQATEKTVADIPSIKLLDFFRSVARANDEITSCDSPRREAGGLPTFSIEGMLRECRNTMRDLQPISREDALLWVRYWQEANYLG